MKKLSHLPHIDNKPLLEHLGYILENLNKEKYDHWIQLKTLRQKEKLLFMLKNRYSYLAITGTCSFSNIYVLLEQFPGKNRSSKNRLSTVLIAQRAIRIATLLFHVCNCVTGSLLIKRHLNIDIMNLGSTYWSLKHVDNSKKFIFALSGDHWPYSLFSILFHFKKSFGWSIDWLDFVCLFCFISILRRFQHFFSHITARVHLFMNPE